MMYVEKSDTKCNMSYHIIIDNFSVDVRDRAYNKGKNETNSRRKRRLPKENGPGSHDDDHCGHGRLSKQKQSGSGAAF